MTIDYRDKKPIPFNPETLVPVSPDFIQARNNLEKVRATLTSPFARLNVRSMEKLLAAETAFVEQQTRHIEAVTERTRALQRQADAIVESALYSPEEREKNIALQLELAECQREQARLDMEHRRAVAELERKAELLEKQRDVDIAQAKRRHAKHFKKDKPSKQAEQAPELTPVERAKMVYTHGVVGPHVLAAEKVAAELRAQADAENFTDQQRNEMEEKIEAMTLDAQRNDLSKGV